LVTTHLGKDRRDHASGVASKTVYPASGSCPTQSPPVGAIINKMKLYIKLIVFTAWVLTAALAPAASTYYVAETGQDTRTGTGDWTNALATISNAVWLASARDTILVSNGIYTISAMISNSVGATIRGAGTNPAAVIVNGNYPTVTNSCFYLRHSNAVLDNLTITNGYASSGGGVYINTGLVQNCVISGNTATKGGGVYISNNKGTLLNSTVSGNLATNGVGGGGVYCVGGSLVSNCVVINNLAFREDNYAHFGGGGIYGAGGAIVLNCLLESNEVEVIAGTVHGGGFSTSYTGGGTVKDCIIRNNKVGPASYLANGGGVFMHGKNNLLRNCLVYSNTGYYGGGVVMRAVAGSDCVMENCTIVGNYGYQGGGLKLVPDTGGTSTVWNSIVYGNFPTSGSWSNRYAAGTGSNLFYNTCIAPLVNGTVTPDRGQSINCISDNPEWFAGSENNYRLTRDSPCVNTGLNQGWMVGAVDLDGSSRIDRFSGVVDMGAYEYLPRGTVFSFR